MSCRCLPVRLVLNLRRLILRTDWIVNRPSRVKKRVWYGQHTVYGAQMAWYMRFRVRDERGAIVRSVSKVLRKHRAALTRVC